VRRLARRYGVELERVTGTGLGGRVTEADVRRHAEKEGKPAPGASSPGTPAVAARPAAPTVHPHVAYAATPPSAAAAAGSVIEHTEFGPVEKRPLRGVRRAISRHLSHAARVVVPVTVTDEADATELAQIRAKEEPAAKQAGVKLTFMPFLIKAAVQALKQHPMLNSVLDEQHEEILIKRYYNVGIAVDTAEGLMVPVVRDVDKKSMLDIAAEIERLAAAAHSRSLKLEQLRGGTFTITNMGAIGGIFATPIVNYPEVAILAVGRMRDRVTARNGQIAVRRIVSLSLTFDHRVIDGGDAARFLNTVIAHIEDPDLLLIKAGS
jgi:pyruvate dehydrogenase E2 component (dihydrolipoamide acetyltransferase)